MSRHRPEKGRRAPEWLDDVIFWHGLPLPKAAI